MKKKNSAIIICVFRKMGSAGNFEDVIKNNIQIDERLSSLTHSSLF